MQSSNPRTGAVVPLTVRAATTASGLHSSSLDRVPGISCEQVLRAIKVRLASVVLGA